MKHYASSSKFRMICTKIGTMYGKMTLEIGIQFDSLDDAVAALKKHRPMVEEVEL